MKHSEDEQKVNESGEENATSHQIFPVQWRQTNRHLFARPKLEESVTGCDPLFSKPLSTSRSARATCNDIFTLLVRKTNQKNEGVETNKKFTQTRRNFNPPLSVICCWLMLAVHTERTSRPKCSGGSRLNENNRAAAAAQSVGRTDGRSHTVWWRPTRQRAPLGHTTECAS